MFEEPDWSIDRARKRKKKRGEDDNDVSITKVCWLIIPKSITQNCYMHSCLNSLRNVSLEENEASLKRGRRLLKQKDWILNKQCEKFSLWVRACTTQLIG